MYLECPNDDFVLVPTALSFSIPLVWSIYSAYLLHLMIIFCELGVQKIFWALPRSLSHAINMSEHIVCLPFPDSHHGIVEFVGKRDYSVPPLPLGTIRSCYPLHLDSNSGVTKMLVFWILSVLVSFYSCLLRAFTLGSIQIHLLLLPVHVSLQHT